MGIWFTRTKISNAYRVLARGVRRMSNGQFGVCEDPAQEYLEVQTTTLVEPLAGRPLTFLDKGEKMRN